MNINILFSDNLHFHTKNFKSLIELIEEKEYTCHYNTEFRDWMALYGDYSSKFSRLKPIYSLISTKSIEELKEYKVHGINAYQTAKAELLAYVLPKKEIYKLDLDKTEENTFNYLYKDCHLELCLNIAAAHHWIDFWYKTIIEPKAKYSHAFVFSGSNIYAKALMKVCEFSQTRIIVAESSLTGNDFYLEEKSLHIANNSDIKNVGVRNAYIKELNSENYFKEKNKAINKLLLSQNKNVQQPSRSENGAIFNNGKPTILIAGQVLNDYSIIETMMPYQSSVEIYKRIISDILDNTEYNFIFKAHPWELKKTNCESDITYQEICDYLSENYNDEILKRVMVTKDYNLSELFEQSDFVAVLNSQAGIEAAFHGLKPIILGNAFYNKFGFTYDTDDLKISNIINNNSGTLTLAEYERFELFLTIYLEKHLISVHTSGKIKIDSRFFTAPNIINLAIPKKVPEKNKETNTNSNVAETKPELSYPIQIKNAVFYLFNDVDKFKRKVRRKFEKTS